MSDSPEHGGKGRARGGVPDLAGYLHKESPQLTTEPQALTRLPTPDDPLPGTTPPAAAPTGDFRDLEKALVERIADVDDDRRRSSVQLRKALETHRDEIRAQRRRDHAAILVLGGIGIILLAAVLLLFTQLVQTRDAMQARLAGLGPATQATEATATASADLDSEIDQLGDAIEAIGDRLTSLEGSSGQREAPASSTPTGAEAAEPALDMAGVEARVAALMDERLASLEARIDELRSKEPQATAAALDMAELEARVAARLSGRLASLEARLDEQRGATPTPSGDAVEAVEAPAEDAASEAEEAAAAANAEALTTDQTTVVLQLAGLPSRAAVARYISRHELPERVYLKVDRLRGRSTWYGLIAGVYPDMDAAEAARAALPPDLAKEDIWLRQLPAGTRLELLDGKTPTQD